MYHLLVTHDAEAWKGKPYVFEANRCLNAGEYTEQALADRYKSLNPEVVAELLQYPCVFAYESPNKLDASLGRLVDVREKGGEVQVKYEINSKYPPIALNDLIRLQWELDIGKWELHRTHWALKNEALSEALMSIGYPEIGTPSNQIVDVDSHTFDVALSFPGEVREYVEPVANNLRVLLGRDSVFYDKFYQAQLARPNLDTALQALYRDRANLIVAFLSKGYASKKWCHIEFRAIKEIINSKQDKRVMFVKHDRARIKGIFSADGYIDATKYNPNEVAQMICERVSILKKTPAKKKPKSDAVKK